ncbi:hypothetical protein F132_40 [Flavobacterium sp. phage 1/32]|nr:hypothetical protein F132_40 [Flavobacterium sp. phage 1/32]
MANIRHLIDGQNLGEPRNWQELEITFNWLEQKEEGAINTTQLELVGKQYKFLRQRLMNGLTGGVGIFEGVPYNIEVGQIGNPKFVFDGYIDGASETTFIGSEEIIANIKKKHGEDWLNDVADGYSFAYLYSIGEITNANFKKVPYVINYVPDGMQMILLSISLFMMTKELIESVKELSQLIGQTVNASTPVIGVSVGFGAGVVTAWDLGDWVMYAVYVIAKIVYIIAILIAIKKLVEELVAQLFPKKRDHLGMTIYDLFDKGTAHLGLTLQSNLLNEVKDWVYIPQKDRKGGESGERGYPTNTDPIYTFGDCIRIFKQMFNADYKIVNGNFIFERVDFWQQNSGLVLPNIFNDQDRLLNRVIPNTSEFVANYNIHWSYDSQDQNTLDDTTGLTFQAITKPQTVVNEALVNMKGLTEISFPFALGKRKDGYTALEEFARAVFKVVDGLTGVFGGGTNFVSSVENRIGTMLLSSHFISVGKIVKMNGDKLATNQRGVLGAKTFWDKYHFVNSFSEINGVHNQWLKMPTLRMPLSEEQIEILMQNNFLTSSDGKRAMIEKLVWQPYKGTAVIDYRINEKYTNNLKVDYVEF